MIIFQQDEAAEITNTNEETNLLKSKKEEENFTNENKVDNSWCNNIYNAIKDKIVMIYSYLIPDSNNRPVICFLFLIAYTFLHSKVILLAIESLSDITKLTASFLGMTIISWAGNVGDALNASVATKLKAADLLTTSILGSQIFNLQICLGVPWLFAIIKGKFGNINYTLDFGKKQPLKYLLTLFIVVLIAVFILTLCGLRLNRKSGLFLTIIYLVYLVYEFKINSE